MQCKAIVAQSTGGPEVLAWRDVDIGDPGAGEIRIRHAAVGLNFIDVYHRTGLYPVEPPFTPGLEGAGVVEAVGGGVTTIAVGDRVAYAAAPMGSYAEARLMPAAAVVTVPDGIADETAAAMMLKGMTAEYLLRRTYEVKAGETILFHAAAGGVGLIACQWAKALGATVIGTVGNDEKADLARAHGCDHPIVYTRDNFVDRGARDYRRQGRSRGLRLGRQGYLRRLARLSRAARSAGEFRPILGRCRCFNPGVLAAKGSLYLSRPTLMTYNASRAELVASAGALFDVVASGKVKIEINNRYPLADAEQGHRDLQDRKTTGSTIFTL